MTSSILRFCIVAGLICLFSFRASTAEDVPGTPDAVPDSTPVDIEKAAASEHVPAESRVTLEVARDRAALMHTVYTATLDAIHHRYFHGDRAIVPARAMEDVFTELAAQTHVRAQWISASLEAMSVNHEPKTPFEKHAAREIAQGSPVVEIIEGGYYRRAGSIALDRGCISCHAGFFKGTSTTPKFAGLVISIPVTPDAVLPPVEPGAAQ
ncbi:MAG: hypothetical protein R3C12_01925 [Planctomycetaceae bacterium]|nr:hypothetical protein [Planctomycetaceae bacterium]